MITNLHTSFYTLLIGLVVVSIHSLIGSIQSQELPLHDSLRNIQVQGETSTSCYSDNNGYHVVNTSCSYSNVEYDDADITVTVTLNSDASSGITAYGITFRNATVQGTGEDYLFALTPDGKAFYDSSFDLQTINLDGQNPSEFQSSAIKKGIGVTNPLEVQTHGSNFNFLINGTIVGTQSDSSMSSSGTIGFYAVSYAPFRASLDTSIEAIFTNLIITKDTQ